MKKKIMAIVAFMLVMAMETITVFATSTTYYPSPTAGTADIGGSTGGTDDTDDTDDAGETTAITTTTDDSGLYLYGDVIMLNGSEVQADGTMLRLYRLTSTGGDITESNNVIIGMIKVGDSDLTELDDGAYEAAKIKLMELAQQADMDGYDIDGIAFNVTSTATTQTIELIDSRVVESDKANGLVKVFHLLPSGEWEEPEFESHDGSVTVYFTNGFSPVLIVKYSKKTNYTTKPTIAGEVTSPKTADIDYSTILITLIAIVCIIVCSSKLTKK